jgi:hypothetical protein
MKHIVTLQTIGDGFWSNKEKLVGITRLEVPYIDGDTYFGELRVYFDPKTWDIKEDGLIYTDTLFEYELREWLKSQGYYSGDVGYSEQGMQGDDYVSLDFNEKFAKSWIAKNEVEFV